MMRFLPVALVPLLVWLPEFTVWVGPFGRVWK